MSANVLVYIQTNAHLLNELVENSRLPNLELVIDNGSVVDTQNRVDILHGLCAHIGHLLDLGSDILDLGMVSEV
jgi:hypothetical protein